MATEAYRRAREFVGRDGVATTSKGGALDLVVQKNGIRVSVSVPESTLEWFANAELSTNGSTVSDWCDYEGYENTPAAQLEHEMAEDVMSFINQLIKRDLRYAVDSKRATKGVLEWLVNGRWQQALPFVPAA